MKKRNSTDVLVGRRLQSRRISLEMSEARLGEAAGLAAHQIRKYELGNSPVPPAHLLRLSQRLRVPVAYFFENAPRAEKDQSATSAGLSTRAAKRAERRGATKSTPKSSGAGSLDAKATRLAYAFSSIPNRQIQQRIYDVVMGLNGLPAD